MHPGGTCSTSLESVSFTQRNKKNRTQQAQKKRASTGSLSLERTLQRPYILHSYPQDSEFVDLLVVQRVAQWHPFADLSDVCVLLVASVLLDAGVTGRFGPGMASFCG